MENKVSATDLARNLGDILSRIRYRGETFVVERNGTAVARIEPMPGTAPAPAREALSAWLNAATPDLALADDLTDIGAADRPPADPWPS